MRRVYVRNPDLSKVEKTSLTASYTSGTSLSVINTFALAANDLIVVERPLVEKAEVKKISAVASDTSLTLASALKFIHDKDTPIFETQWDFVDIEGNSGTGFALLSQSGLQYDKQHTIYEHSAGTSAWSYRWRFYNSVSSTYSEYSPTYSGAGFEANQVGYMIQQVRKLTDTDGDTETIRDYEIVRALNAAQDIVYGLRPDWWFLKFEDDDITTTASTFRYNLDRMGGGSAGSPAANFTLGHIDKVRFNYDDGVDDQIYNLLFLSEVEFDDLVRDNNREEDDRMSHYTIRPPDSSSVNGYIEGYPTPKTTGRGTFNISAYRKFAVLEDDIDETPVPIPGVLENYAISVVERIRGNDNKAEYYEELFYGPPPSREGIRRVTGIALLEQLQDRNRPVSQPRNLWRFRGQRAITRLFAERYTNPDYRRETFF